MPNKVWNMNIDLLPGTTSAFNLGNASKKWVVNGYSLDDACAKGVTDYTSSASPDSTDINLVTGRAVYWIMNDLVSFVTCTIASGSSSASIYNDWITENTSVILIDYDSSTWPSSLSWSTSIVQVSGESTGKLEFDFTSNATQNVTLKALLVKATNLS